MAKRYGRAAAFKAALESNLRKLATQRTLPLSTLQLKLGIERLLARLFHTSDPPWRLKGGFAMDLRFRPRARTTKDIDLSLALPARAAPVDFAGELREESRQRPMWHSATTGFSRLATSGPGWRPDTQSNQHRGGLTNQLCNRLLHKSPGDTSVWHPAGKAVPSGAAPYVYLHRQLEG
jgi:hypothetical protein